MIDQERLLKSFLHLVAVDSPSGQEAALTKMLADRLSDLGVDPWIDPMGNLIARIPGEGSWILLSAHMDTVPPCQGVKPVLKDGWVYTDGSTILGADDKSGIAVILEALTSLREDHRPHSSVELVFTVGEEIGLLGAKGLDPSSLNAKEGIVLDHGSPVEAMIVKAPGQNSLDVTVHGRAAHAGVCPEKGINAIQVASEAISRMPLGRIDDETTANVGTIKGGNARNIVPELVEIRAEARSHDEDKLHIQTQRMIKAFQEAASQYGATVDLDVARAYFPYVIPLEAPIVQRSLKASRSLETDLQLQATGGGSDANVFNQKGITTIILSTGYHDNHTTSERIRLSDMVKSAALLAGILELGA